MKDATKKILSELSQRGYRVTGARKQVIDGLAISKTALTIQALAKRVAVDEASVYRTIETLRDESLVEEIVVKGKRPKYALMHGHHHHLVCSGCGRIAHVPCSGSIAAPKSVPGFLKIDGHEVTFYGVCNICA